MWGVSVRGIDMVFLQVALQIARSAVYSLHKTSTREHILRKAQQWGVKVQIVFTIRYDIPKMYHFHKQSSKDIEVDLIRFTH